MRGTKRYKSGAWRLQVWDAPADRYRHRTFHAPNTPAGTRAADEALAELVVEVRDSLGRARATDTVADVFERWLAVRTPHWSPSTVQTHRIWAAKISDRIGAVRIDRLSPVHIDNLYLELRANGGRHRQTGAPTPLAPATLRRVHQVLHAAMAQAVRWQLIDRNPADQVNVPTVDKTKRATPSDEELRRLFAAVIERPLFALWLRLAAITGARRGQLCALRWSDLNLDDAEMTIARGIVYTANGGTPVERRTTKSGETHRVALDPVTVTQLRSRRTQAAEQVLAAGAGLARNAFVFARDVAGTDPWRPNTVTHWWIDLRRGVLGDAGDRYRLHDIRHYTATTMLAGGESVPTTSSRLGHRSAAMTLDVYAYAIPAADHAAAQRLAAHLDG